MSEKNCFKVNAIGCYKGFCKIIINIGNDTYSIIQLFDSKLRVVEKNGQDLAYDTMLIEDSPLADFEDRIKREIVKEQM